MRKLCSLLLPALLLSLTGVRAADRLPIPDCDRDPALPRVVIISLDGVPFRTIEMAREQGAFGGWPTAVPLVSTFPSMTNVAFAAVYRPFGLGPISGYEMLHFDGDKNDTVGGGPVGYKKNAYGWRDYYHVMSRTTWQKRGTYFYPNRKVANTMEKLAQEVLQTDREVVVAHVGTTDPLAHFRGDDRVVQALLAISEALDDLRRRHREERDRELTFVLLSDHGNTSTKVRFDDGIRDRLRDAGLRVNDSLKQPRDVVTPTYGVVSFGALFTAPENAETAARAVVGHNGINLGAWISEPGRIRVISAEHEAEIRWAGAYGARRIGYFPVDGDPLLLLPAVQRLREANAFDEDGLAGENLWFAESALEEFPDAPRRLIDGLEGTFVAHEATVLLSFEEGYAWGVFPARLAAHMLGGLIGTHGGLDRVSSLGFFLTDAEDYPEGPAVRADRALAPWSHLGDCILPVHLDDEDEHQRELNEAGNR